MIKIDSVLITVILSFIIPSNPSSSSASHSAEKSPQGIDEFNSGTLCNTQFLGYWEMIMVLEPLHPLHTYHKFHLRIPDDNFLHVFSPPRNSKHEEMIGNT